MIEKLLRNIRFEENEHSDNMYASETTYCLRKLYYKRKGIPSTHSIETEINFTQGNALHTLFEELIVTKAVDYGYRGVNEVKLNIEGIHGIIDVMLVNKKEIHIIELKTVLKLPKTPFKNHLTQLMIYMYPYMKYQKKHKKTVKGYLFYIEKAVLYGNSPRKEFEVKYDESIIDEALERTKLLNYDLEKNILPPAEAFIKKEHWECNWCPYLKRCREDDGKW